MDSVTARLVVRNFQKNMIEAEIVLGVPSKGISMPLRRWDVPFYCTLGNSLKLMSITVHK
jgi:hypothetical protein